MTPVSETLALKIENLQLKLEALRRQFEELHTQQQALLRDARQEVGASPEAVTYDFSSRLFTVPHGHPPLSVPDKRRAKRANGHP